MSLDWQSEYYRYRRHFVDFRQVYRQKKVRVYTEIILSIVTVIFFVVFAIKPTLVTITSLVKEIKDKRVVSQKLGERITSLSKAQKNYQDNQADFYLIDEALPIKPEPSLLLGGLENMILDHDLIASSLQFEEIDLRGSQIAAGLKEIDFSITASGEYQNLKDFLSVFNNLRRIIVLEQFDFQIPKEGESVSGSLTLNLSGKVYYYQ